MCVRVYGECVGLWLLLLRLDGRSSPSTVHDTDEIKHNMRQHMYVRTNAVDPSVYNTNTCKAVQGKVIGTDSHRNNVHRRIRPHGVLLLGTLRME